MVFPKFHIDEINKQEARDLTLEDTVEFFNLVTNLKLNAQEKADLVAFMKGL